MDISKGFKRYDPKEEAEWHEYNEMKFLICPIGTPLQKKKIKELFTLKEAVALEEHGAMAFDDVKANVAIGRVYQLYSQSLVLDWKDVEENGKKLAFSAEKIHEWMMEFPEFANWITLTASELRTKQLEAKEELVKN